MFSDETQAFRKKQRSDVGKSVISGIENLDYFQVFYSLCESLTQLYEKFNNLDVEHKHHYEEFLAFDNKIKHHIISKISNDMNDLAQSVLHDQLETMENLLDDPGQGLCVMYEENW